MKRYDAYIINSRGDWAEITDEDIKQYPVRYDTETSYIPGDDITIIWARQILCLPEFEVELNKTIINFVFGTPDMNPNYIEQALRDFRTIGKRDITIKSMFELEDK